MVASSLANDPQQRLTFMVRLQHNFFYIVGAISRAPNAKFQFSDSEDRVQFWSRMNILWKHLRHCVVAGYAHARGDHY